MFPYETRSSHSAKRSRILIHTLFIFCVFFIALNQPYCHDDWAWGMPFRVKLLKNWFANYNGRYLANILIMGMTRNTVLKVLVPTGFMFLLLRSAFSCGTNDLRERRFSTLLLFETIFLLTALPATLYEQSYGWLSAFVNFVPPAILFLIWFRFSEWIYDQDSPVPASGAAACILFALLGTVSQLFAEHSTLLITAYAFWSILLPVIRRRKVPAVHLTYAAGCLAGFIMMYSNPVYRNGMASEKDHAFKGITLSLSSLYYQLRDKMLDDLFLNNVLLNVLLALFAVLLVARLGRHLLVKRTAIPCICGYAFYLIWHRLHPEWVLSGNPGHENTFRLFLSALFSLCLLIGMLDSLSGASRWSIPMLYLCSLGAAAPIAAANPIGARCFYFTYALQCVVLIRISAFLADSAASAWSEPRLRNAEFSAGIIVLCLAVVYLRIFAAIGSTDRARAALIREAAAAQADTLTLPVMPYSDFTWKAEPEADGWRKYFKTFYCIPEGTELYFE